MEPVEIAEGIRRVTFPLPTPPGHVHGYLLRGADGWTLVDTGLGLPDAEERWTALARVLDAPLARIAITHFHPDHVGGAADAAAVTGASVLQGRLDYEQCEQVWGNEEWPRRIADWFLAHGVPAPVAEQLLEQALLFRHLIRFAPDPRPLDEGDAVDGWVVLDLPGHADGHVGLLGDGVLIAGDHLLPRISPAVGLYPEGRPDPLGDYLASLRRTVELAPRLALPGHGEPIEDPAGRALELLEHHRVRLDETAAALGSEPRTAHELSLTLFGADLPSASQRRFAVAETLSHVERLVCRGRAVRAGDGGIVSYTAA